MFGQRNTTMKAQSWLRHSVTNSNPQSGYTASSRLVSQSAQSSHLQLTGAMSFDHSPFKAMTLNIQQSSVQPQQSRLLAQNSVPIAVASSPVTPTTLKSNTTKSLPQASTTGNLHVSSKDNVFHKKLDRSFSEPAERKCATTVLPQNGSVSTRYKTELCRSFVESGSCKYGEKCQFAHGNDELRAITRHPKFKTENCRRFHTVGFCPYGPRCHFIHNGEEEQRKFSLGYTNSASANNCSTGSSDASISVSTSINSAFASDSGLFCQNSSFFSDSSSPTSPNSASAFCSLSNFNSNEPLDSLLVRPKALSFGSTSLGSSGEISTASSSSQSPTSLGSFFNEFDTMFNVPSIQSAFSVSPDSFTKLSPWTPVFGGSQQLLKPDEANSDIPDSLLFNLVGANTQQDIFTEKSFFDHYPSVSVSPSVDSVNSELEALKISSKSGNSCSSASNGSESSVYSPVSAFSSTGSSPTLANSSAFNRYDSFFSTTAPPTIAAATTPGVVCNQRARLPTFAKFSTNTQQ